MEKKFRRTFTDCMIYLVYEGEREREWEPKWNGILVTKNVAYVYEWCIAFAEHTYIIWMPVCNQNNHKQTAIGKRCVFGMCHNYIHNTTLYRETSRVLKQKWIENYVLVSPALFLFLNVFLLDSIGSIPDCLCACMCIRIYVHMYSVRG